MTRHRHRPHLDEEIRPQDSPSAAAVAFDAAAAEVSPERRLARDVRGGERARPGCCHIAQERRARR